MQALVTVPGVAHSAEVGEVPEPRPHAGEVLLRPLEVGVCGTDREIADGLFGVAPDGEERLVLGHELLARVARDGHGFAQGDLVAATVRRSCGRCAACGQGAPDACDTGLYLERGITRLHGFASELAVEAAEHLVPIPAALGRLGVLAEPASVCARALRHARAIGERQPWSPHRALVLGAGAIGALVTTFLRLDGFDVWTADRLESGGDRAQLLAAFGATYVSTSEIALDALHAETGGFDVVVEAAGDAQLMLDALALLRRKGVACLLGIDGRPHRVSVEGRILGVDSIIESRALFGSVNAHRDDWTAAVERLDRARRHWPDAVEQLVGLRVPLDEFERAFAFRGGKATLRLA